MNFCAGKKNTTQHNTATKRNILCKTQKRKQKQKTGVVIYIYMWTVVTGIPHVVISGLEARLGHHAKQVFCLCAVSFQYACLKGRRIHLGRHRSRLYTQVFSPKKQNFSAKKKNANQNILNFELQYRKNVNTCGDWGSFVIG